MVEVLCKGVRVSLDELVCLCRFEGCAFSAIVSLDVRNTYLPKVLELAFCEKGVP